MRQYLSTIIIAAVVALGTVWALPQATPTSQETALDRVLNTGVIRCGYYTWPGLIEKNVTTGKMEGLLAEFMPTLAQSLDLKVEWTEEVGTDQMMHGLMTKRYDVICSPIFELPSRARSGLMTSPVFYLPTYAYVRAGDKRFDYNHNLLNSPKVSFAAMDGEFSEVFARQAFPLATIVPVPALAGMSQVYLTVTSQRADVVLSEPITADTYINNNPGKLRQIAGQPIYVGPAVFAVGPQEWQLQQFMNVGIRGLHDQGLIKKLMLKYPDLQKYIVHPTASSSGVTAK